MTRSHALLSLARPLVSPSAGLSSVTAAGLARPALAASPLLTHLPVPCATQQSRSIVNTPQLGAVKDAISAVLHGSSEAREEAGTQHSRLVGRHKYVYEFQKHKVLPHHVEQYKELIADYYKGIHNSSEFDARLTGSWEVVVGEVDSFVHVFEYDGMPGFEQTKHAIRESKGHLTFFNKEILPLIQSRTSQLNTEFKFWQVSPPAEKGGIYELRTYDIKPGALLEWEHEWRVGLEARLASGHYPVGAWFSQVGKLHQVHHLWQYQSMEARRIKREQSWQIDGWSGTVSKTVRLTKQMQTNILRPLPFSPLR
ncbi:NIPSNAP family protein [Sporobolomyces koalae]|uniref:NIPSNAP family protein n=1 Tax=Sporobolomyces koalae TaxID=500713 RepID=UPI003171F75A